MPDGEPLARVSRRQVAVSLAHVSGIESRKIPTERGKRRLECRKGGIESRCSPIESRTASIESRKEATEAQVPGHK